MDRPLVGRIAVVTGGSRGVGGAIALALADAGAVVVAISRRAGLPRGAGSTISPVAADLAGGLAALDEVCADVQRRLGRVSILVHAAGIFAAAPIADAPVSDLDALLRVHVRSPFLITRRLLPDLRATAGDIVFISSATRSRATVGPYAASKAALVSLADSLREEVNEDGLRVLTVHLGRTDTDMQRSVHLAEGRDYDARPLIPPATVARAVVSAIGLPPPAQVTDLRLVPVRR